MFPGFLSISSFFIHLLVLFYAWSIFSMMVNLHLCESRHRLSKTVFLQLYDRFDPSIIPELVVI